MKQEVIATGKTVEAAVLSGAEEMGVDRNFVTYEVLEMPKKGFLGFGEIPAKVKVCYEAGTESVALDFVTKLLEDMKLDAKATISDIPGKGKLIKIEGADASRLIGYHGETLDGLQYLVNLAVNNSEEGRNADGDDEFSRVTIDIGDYRLEREATLKALAKRKAHYVLKSKKPIALEPMQPYERKIIHSVIQDMDGVTTNSTGSDNNRRVVIYPEGYVAPEHSKKQGKRNGSSGGRRRNRRKPKSEANTETVQSPVEASAEE